MTIVFFSQTPLGPTWIMWLLAGSCICCCLPLLAFSHSLITQKVQISTCIFGNLSFIQTCYSFNFPFWRNVEFTIYKSGCDDRYKTWARSTHLHTREFHKIILHTSIVWYELICPKLCTCPGCRGQLCLAVSGMRERSICHWSMFLHKVNDIF